jgi:ribonuclease H2 subunit B
VRAAQQPIVNPGKETKGTKRKALPASRGVESLKKVNTSKMNKLTSFFKPKEEKK